MLKFLGQGSNSSHSSDLSCSSDNAGFSTPRPPENSQGGDFYAHLLPVFSFFFDFILYFFVFLGVHPWHMEVPRLGVEWELQLLATATATVMQDLSRICDLHHSSRQCRVHYL